MRLLAFTLCCAIFSQQAAVASPATDTLMTCVKDSTNGKDRKEVARWMFLAMSAHPEIQSLSNASGPARVESQKKLATLAERLLTETCRDQARAAVEKEGTRVALESAFSALGEIAMMELMLNPNVNEAVTGYTEYLDMEKLKPLLGK